MTDSPSHRWRLLSLAMIATASAVATVILASEPSAGEMPAGGEARGSGGADAAPAPHRSERGARVAAPAVSSNDYASRKRIVTVRLSYRITPGRCTTKSTLTVLLPPSLGNWQGIRSISYSVQPSDRFVVDGQSYARFVFASLREESAVDIRVEAEILRHDLAAATQTRDGPSSVRQALDSLGPERFIESDAAPIVETARRLTAPSDLARVRAFTRFLTHTLTGIPWDKADHGAAWALENRRGDCSEFSDLFVALCRASGIPARVWDGLVIDQPISTPLHAWAEAYLEPSGWIAFDPRGAPWPDEFDKLNRDRIYMSCMRNNPTLNGWHFYSYQWSGPSLPGEKIGVEMSCTVEDSRFIR